MKNLATLVILIITRICTADYDESRLLNDLKRNYNRLERPSALYAEPSVITVSECYRNIVCVNNIIMVYYILDTVACLYERFT